MENARPYKGVKFELRLLARWSIHKKVKIKVAPDSVEVVFDVFNLFESSEHLDILHLIIDHPVKSVNQIFSQLEGEFVFWKCS